MARGLGVGGGCNGGERGSSKRGQTAGLGRLYMPSGTLMLAMERTCGAKGRSSSSSLIIETEYDFCSKVDICD
jgi:hypothetical protein